MASKENISKKRTEENYPIELVATIAAQLFCAQPESDSPKKLENAVDEAILLVKICRRKLKFNHERLRIARNVENEARRRGISEKTIPFVEAIKKITDENRFNRAYKYFDRLCGILLQVNVGPSSTPNEYPGLFEEKDKLKIASLHPMLADPDRDRMSVKDMLILKKYYTIACNKSSLGKVKKTS